MALVGLPYLTGGPKGIEGARKLLGYLPISALPSSAPTVVDKVISNDVYKWQDKYGQWHYEDKPKTDKTNEQIANDAKEQLSK